MKIALDMDGFLAEFTQPFTELAKAHGLVAYANNTAHQPTWDFPYDTTGLWHTIDSTPNWWMTLNPMFNADELAMINKLVGRHQVHVITNRKTVPGLQGYSAREQVYHWLISMGVKEMPMARIHVGTHRGDKGKLAAQIGIHLAGDDHIPNLDDYEACGVHAVALVAPYNHDWTGVKVNSLMEFCVYAQDYSDSGAYLHKERVTITPEGEEAIIDLPTREEIASGY